MSGKGGSFGGSRAVVFGGSGFIGSHVASELVSRGAEVLLFDLRAPEHVAKGVSVVLGDITDPAAVARTVEGADHVLALAGSVGALRSIAEPLLDLETSCKAQAILLEAIRAKAPGATVVFAGSRLEYGQPQTVPVDEEHPLRPETPYAINKAACSAYHRAYARLHGLRTTVLRLPNPYGSHVQGAPRSAGFGILNMFVDTALDGGCIRLYGGGTQLRDFVHIDDVVSAMLQALSAPEGAGQVFNIGSGTPHSLREAAEIVVRLCGTGSIDGNVEWPEMAAAVETGDFYFDITKAERLLGWQPVIGLEDGLRRVVDSMRDGRDR